MMHPTDRQLIDHLLEQGMDEGARLRTLRHVEACATCGRKLREYESLVHTMRTDELAEPPAEWVEKAIRGFSASPVLERVRAWCAGLPEELARLVLDTAGPPELALAGVRSVESGRRLRFESDGLGLEVQIEPRHRGGTLVGQIVRRTAERRPLARARFLVTAANREAIDGTTDDLGEFSVETADLTDLRLRVVADDELVTFAVPEASELGS